MAPQSQNTTSNRPARNGSRSALACTKGTETWAAVTSVWALRSWERLASSPTGWAPWRASWMDQRAAPQPNRERPCPSTGRGAGGTYRKAPRPHSARAARSAPSCDGGRTWSLPASRTCGSPGRGSRTGRMDPAGGHGMQGSGRTSRHNLCPATRGFFVGGTNRTPAGSSACPAARPTRRAPPLEIQPEVELVGGGHLGERVEHDPLIRDGAGRANNPLHQSGPEPAAWVLGSNEQSLEFPEPVPARQSRRTPRPCRPPGRAGAFRREARRGGGAMELRRRILGSRGQWRAIARTSRKSRRAVASSRGPATGSIRRTGEWRPPRVLVRATAAPHGRRV